MHNRLVCLLVFVCQVCFSQGLLLDSATYVHVPQKSSSEFSTPLPTQVDMSAYVPKVMDQGSYDTCVPFSTTYYMRTIMEAIKLGTTKPKEVNALRFSPSYIYNEIASEKSKEDCKGSTFFEDALEVLKTKGALKLSQQEYPFCQKNLPIVPDSASRIADYVRLFSLIDDDDKVINTKKALAEKSPVVVGLETTVSLQHLDVFTWILHKIKAFFGFEDPEFGLWIPSDDELEGGHAVCLIGYDDSKFGKGAFKAVNSWGYLWGDDGFFWISYVDYERLAKQAFQAYLQDDIKSDFSASLIYLTNIYGAVADKFSPENEAKVYFNKNQSERLLAYKVVDPIADNSIFRYKLSNDHQMYLYLLDEDPFVYFSKVVFPDPDDGVIELIGPNTKVILPLNEKIKWQLSGAPATEKAVFLFSKQKLDIWLIQKEMNKLGRMDLGEKLEKILGTQLIPQSQIKYESNNPYKMGFRVEKNHTGSVVPLMFSFEHIL